ncbi:MAG: RNA polymerase sigma-70 factor [Bacteroidales bacterium]|nr:RNA polymerase sigma-70 factor [Bacteroidales bacterium]
MKETIKNRELFKKFAEKDEYTFEQAYRLYFPRLFTYSMKIVGDKNMAKDVVQDVFIKLWENPKVLDTDNPEAFIFTTVRNASLNFVRHLKVIDNLKIKVQEKYEGDELYYIDFIGSEPTELIDKELQTGFEKVLNSLPRKCREVFSLSRKEGLKNREIAEKLNISTKNVEKHISRALSIYRTNFANLIPF